MASRGAEKTVGMTADRGAVVEASMIGSEEARSPVGGKVPKGMEMVWGMVGEGVESPRIAVKGLELTGQEGEGLAIEAMVKIGMPKEV